MKTVNHSTRVDTNGKTYYGIAKDILETMSRLKDIDHHASFEVVNYRDSDRPAYVAYRWQTEEEL